MNALSRQAEDYARVEQAIRYLEAHALRQPALAEVAAQVGLSEYHFQRLFRRWAGISPKRFLQFLTKERALALLAESSVLEAAYGVGLSSPSRLHDLLVQTEALTPGEVRSRGRGVAIAYGRHPSPFGECLLAVTGRGICFLGFVDQDLPRALGELERNWPNARLSEDPDRTAPLVERIFGPPSGSTLSLHLAGTNFQLKVWEALLRLPPGRAASYSRLADWAGAPRAVRAAAGAVAANPIAFLIPCHRILQQSGGFGGYRYGPARKKAMLGWELARAEGVSGP